MMGRLSVYQIELSSFVLIYKMGFFFQSPDKLGLFLVWWKIPEHLRTFSLTKLFFEFQTNKGGIKTPERILQLEGSESNQYLTEVREWLKLYVFLLFSCFVGVMLFCCSTNLGQAPDAVFFRKDFSMHTGCLSPKPYHTALNLIFYLRNLINIKQYME